MHVCITTKEHIKILTEKQFSKEMDDTLPLPIAWNMHHPTSREYRQKNTWENTHQINDDTPAQQSQE